VAQKKLRKKSVLMTAYLNVLLKASKYYVPLKSLKSFEAKQNDKKRFRPGFTIITPDKEELRGAQLSILLLPRKFGLLRTTSQFLVWAGVLGDEREPDVIRFSPVPFYNSYRDCWITANTFDWALKVSRANRFLAVCCADGQPMAERCSAYTGKRQELQICQSGSAVGRG